MTALRSRADKEREEEKEGDVSTPEIVFLLLKKHCGCFPSYSLSDCVCRIILRLLHEPISDDCALVAARNCFSPGRESAIKLLISSSNPETILLMEAAQQ